MLVSPASMHGLPRVRALASHGCRVSGNFIPILPVSATAVHCSICSFGSVQSPSFWLAERCHHLTGPHPAYFAHTLSTSFVGKHISRGVEHGHVVGIVYDEGAYGQEMDEMPSAVYSNPRFP